MRCGGAEGEGEGGEGATDSSPGELADWRAGGLNHRRARARSLPLPLPLVLSLSRARALVGARWRLLLRPGAGQTGYWLSRVAAPQPCPRFAV